MSLTSKHDKFIRAILADKEIAIDYFRTALPAYIVERLDFSTLTQLPDTYVSNELRKAPITIRKRAMTTLDYLREDGRQEEREKAIRNMILKGSTTEFICDVLEVTPD